MSLASATASASSSNGSTATTGPNTSSRQTGSAVERGSTTVGGYQNPGPAGALPRNATSTGAPPASAPPSTKPRTLSRWPALISGPMSTSGCAGDPTRSPVTAGSSSSRNRSYTVRSTRIRERAQQSWPALSNTPAGAFAAARSTSASAKTMFADLPPSSRVTRLTWSAACRRMCVPTSVDPVNTILRTCSWVTSRSPTTEPLPGSTVNTPGGRPASRPSSARRSAVSGVSSAGLRTTVLPAASAGANPHPAIGMGKFHGTMIPTTPSGSRNVTSRPPATGIWRPNRRSGAAA